MNTTAYNIITKNNKTKESIITANATGWKNALDTLDKIIFEKTGEGWRYHSVSTYTFPHYIYRGASYNTAVTMYKYSKEKDTKMESWFLYIKKA